MGYKTISLSDEAYEKLASLKEKGESFTDIVIRLCSGIPKKPLSSFAGAWSMTEEEEKRVFGEVAELWKKYEKDLLRHRLPSRLVEK